MGRRLLKLLVFLVLGAAINVAVAWGLAYRALELFKLRASVPDLATFGYQQRQFPVDRYPAWVEVALNEMDQPGVLASKEPAEPGYPPRLRAFTRPREIIVHESGWPAMAMVDTRYFGLHEFYVPLSLGGQHNEMSGIGVPFDTDGIRRELFGQEQLPLVPLWPGFAINTILYASIFWLLFAAPYAIRRRRRVKRGLCPACAYPAGASDVCTECGSPATAQCFNGEPV